MTVLGLRFCHVAASADAVVVAKIFGDGLAMPQMDLSRLGLPGNQGRFIGAIFPVADKSWHEIWPES